MPWGIGFHEGTRVKANGRNRTKWGTSTECSGGFGERVGAGICLVKHFLPTRGQYEDWRESLERVGAIRGRASVWEDQKRLGYCSGNFLKAREKMGPK